MSMQRTRRTLLIGGLAGAGALLFGASARLAAKPKERVIKVTARKFAYTPDLIKVRKGEAVVLELTAIDFTHGFSIPDLKLRADLVPGKAVRIALKPEQAGTLEFLCDNFCGDGHETMNGKIVVSE